jgi:diaminopimelate decarboxylase
LSDTTAPPHPGCTAGLKAALTGRHDASFVWRCNFEVDGGTNHHMAAVGVGSGPLCTPNDVIGRRVPLPLAEPGDLPGVERSGGYGPSASPGLFLSHGFPAEVLVHCGVPYLVQEPDTTEELLRKQRIVRLG